MTSGSTASFSTVNSGTWDVGVTAYNGTAIVAVGSLSGQVVAAGASLTWTVPLSGSQTGTGNFSFTFAFPSSTNVNYVAGQLYNVTTGAAVGSPIIPTLTTNGSNLQGTIAQSGIASGSYRLGLTFFRGGAGGTTAGTFSEAVNVWDNVTSDKWLDSSGNLNGIRTFAATDFNSSNANLSNLTATSGKTALVLSPGFSSNVYTYAATGGSTISLSPVQSVSGQKVQYQVNGGTWTDIGSSSASVTLTLGGATSAISFKVTASDQASTATYVVTLALQTISLGSGTNGTAAGSVTYGATTTNVPDGTSGVFTWYTSSAGTTTTTAPTGVTASVSAVASNAATVTMAVGATAVAGNYYFTLAEGSALSSVTTLAVLGSAATPTFNPAAGTYGSNQSVTLSCSTPGATIYYTMDGTTPTTSSTIYTTPIGLIGHGATVTIKAIAAATGYVTSSVGSASYTLNQGAVVVGVQLGQYQALSFSPSSLNVMVGQSLNFSPSFTGGSQWQWFVNGATVSTASSLSYTPSVPGLYQISLLVQYNGVLYSGSVAATVRLGLALGSTLSPSGTVTTLAGSTASGSANGAGSAASFHYPCGITTDGTNLYVADEYNNEIRKVVIATGVVTTLAGSGSQGSANGTGSAASFYYPSGITTDGIYLYVADEYNNEIRQVVIATGTVTTLAGSTASGSFNSTGSAASFHYPCGITTDGTNLYVADEYNNEIRKVVIATGAVTTFAGSTVSGSANGTGSAASFHSPWGITTDGSNLYIADSNNNEIRQVVIATGAVTTLAGSTASGSANGTGSAASFSYPCGITTDGISLYVEDTNNNEIRRVVIATGAVTTLAGSTTSGSANGTGSAASFNAPCGITTDGSSLYIADTNNNEIRVIQ